MLKQYISFKHLNQLRVRTISIRITVVKVTVFIVFLTLLLFLFFLDPRFIVIPFTSLVIFFRYIRLVISFVLWRIVSSSSFSLVHFSWVWFLFLVFWWFWITPYIRIFFFIFLLFVVILFYNIVLLSFWFFNIHFFRIFLKWLFSKR